MLYYLQAAVYVPAPMDAVLNKQRPKIKHKKKLNK